MGGSLNRGRVPSSSPGSGSIDSPPSHQIRLRKYVAGILERVRAPEGEGEDPILSSRVEVSESLDLACWSRDGGVLAHQWKLCSDDRLCYIELTFLGSNGSWRAHRLSTSPKTLITSSVTLHVDEFASRGTHAALWSLSPQVAMTLPLELNPSSSPIGDGYDLTAPRPRPWTSISSSAKPSRVRAVTGLFPAPTPRTSTMRGAVLTNMSKIPSVPLTGGPSIPCSIA